MSGRDTASLLLARLLLVLFHTWGAWAAVEVNTQDKVDVYVGNTAQIPCTFTSDEGIGGTSIQWFFVSFVELHSHPCTESGTVTNSNDKQRIYFHDSIVTSLDKDPWFKDRISVNHTGAFGEVVLTITDVKPQDEREFICLVKGFTDGVGEGRTRLQVFASPNRPTIEGVQTGISVDKLSKIGSCEVKNGYPKPNITWYKNSTPLRSDPDRVQVESRSTTQSSGLISVVSELSMKVKKEDKDAQFYCEVTYVVPKDTMMTESSRINITVYYPSTAVDIWVESPTGKIKEGDSIKLHCTSNGNMPSFFSIKNVKDDSSFDVATLVLKDVTREKSGKYECTSTDTETFTEISNSTTVFVNYLDEAVISPRNTIVVPRTEELKATCNALSSLQTRTAWLKDGKEVSTGHTLIVKNATYDMAGQYTCVVSVPEIEGMKTTSTLQVHVEGPPVLIEGDITMAEVEVQMEDIVELKCSFRGYPVPTISWSTPNGEDFKRKSEHTEQSAESTLSVKVSSDMMLHCNATNDYGTSIKLFIIKAVTTIHTTTSSTTSTTTTTTTTTTTISNATVQTGPSKPTSQPASKKESNGVVIAVIIICILLLAILGSVLYFLYKKGKICGRSGKQDFNKGKSGKDNVVVEMKSDKTEEAILLGVNGEKQSPGDQ
ncbi:melanoma cell adhesion molecule b [Xenentodon cancila]